MEISQSAIHPWGRKPPRPDRRGLRPLLLPKFQKLFCRFVWVGIECGVMDTENATMLGTAMITLTSLLGSYYMILKIREQHSERPDPKLTYVTHAQEETMQSISEAVRDLRALRAEIREETRAVQKQHARSLSETRDLVGKNAQNISALIAQAQIAGQRIAELSAKTDRIVLKMKGEI